MYTDLGFISCYFDKVIKELARQRLTIAQSKCGESCYDIPGQVYRPLLYISKRVQ